MSWLDYDREPGKWDDVPESYTAQEAGLAAEQAKLPPFVPFASREVAEIASIPDDVKYITVNGLDYQFDVNGTALMTADGKTWSPLNEPRPEHYGLTKADFTTFHDWQFIPSSQIRFIRAEDVDSQDANAITAGLQAMHDAMMAYVSGGSGPRNVEARYSGTYAVNDELFTETFAQSLWDLPQTENKFSFVSDGRAVFKATGWPSHKAVRNSGLWVSVADAVPMAMFRWEQATKKGFGPLMRNIKFEGEQATTDPIGIKCFNINKRHFDMVDVSNFANFGRFDEDVNNSREMHPTVSKCGYQPTNFGGTGFISTTARFSTVAGAGVTTITCNEPIFMADHVGKLFSVASAGAGGNAFVGMVTAVGSSTSITVDQQCASNETGVTGSFMVLTGSTTADSNILALDVEISTDLTGRYVMVHKASSKIHVETELLVTRVVAQAGITLTLASQAGATTSSVPVMLASGRFMGKSDDQSTTSGHNNDYSIFAERNEFSFDPARGSAVNSIYQLGFELTGVGCKSHGTDPHYNNFGSGFASIYLDSCKNISLIKQLIAWNGHHPDFAKVIVTGARNDIEFPNISIGNATEGEVTGFFYLDPATANEANCRFKVGGFNGAASGWPNARQDVFRYGPNGREAQIMALGPFTTRHKASLDGMPPLRADRIQITSGWQSFTPALFVGGTDISAGGGAYAGTNAEYKIVDDLAYVRILITLTSLGANTGNVTIPLPEAIAPFADDHAIGTADYANMNAMTSAASARTDVVNGIDLFRLNAGGTGTTPVTHANLTATARLELSGFYRIAV